MEIDRISKSNFQSLSTAGNKTNQQNLPKEPEQQKMINQVKPKKEHDLSKENIEKTVDSMNKFLEPSHTSARFQFHEGLEEYYVQLVDKDTKEVIKEIPPEKMLDMYYKMLETMGLFVDRKI